MWLLSSTGTFTFFLTVTLFWIRHCALRCPKPDGFCNLLLMKGLTWQCLFRKGVFVLQIHTSICITLTLTRCLSSYEWSICWRCQDLAAVKPWLPAKVYWFSLRLTSEYICLQMQHWMSACITETTSICSNEHTSGEQAAMSDPTLHSSGVIAESNPLGR